MNDVLEIDTEALTATVEPGVTMGEMTDILLPLGLALQALCNLCGRRWDVYTDVRTGCRDWMYGSDMFMKCV